MSNSRVTPQIKNFPEIVFGLVGAIGSELTAIQDKIRNSLVRHVKPQTPKLVVQGIKLIDCVQSRQNYIERDAIEKDIQAEKTGNHMPAELEKRLRGFLANWSPSKVSDDPGVRRYIAMLAGDVSRQKIARILKTFEDNVADNCAMSLFAVDEMRECLKNILGKRG
jgi:hypothetical protein